MASGLGGHHPAQVTAVTVVPDRIKPTSPVRHCFDLAGIAIVIGLPLVTVLLARRSLASPTPR